MRVAFFLSAVTLTAMVVRRTNPHARRLRRDQTDVEQIIWLAVRDRRLGGHKLRRNATLGGFVADFLCVERRLVIELDGSQHGDAADLARTAQQEAWGYRVLRFWNNEVIENKEGVLLTILAALEEGSPPSPNPLPPAGEG